MIDNKLLKSEERAIITLRSLYSSGGYLPFKMSKFEEYDMYVQNKDFLVSDRIITFAGTDGRLLALKPDVTLSILKSTRFEPGVKNRYYYNENVYRPSGSTGQYKEIMQTGVENIGDLDVSDLLEVILLAAGSLAEISADFVLDISHMGVLASVLDGIGCDSVQRKRLVDCISAKSPHMLREACSECGISDEQAELLCSLASVDVGIKSATAILDELFSDDVPSSVSELKALASLLSTGPLSDNIRLDFSMVGNTSYYNGITLCGFIPGICERVLAGGEYGGLLRAMGVSGRGVGFAVYLDLLSELDTNDDDYDVDVLLLYGEQTTPDELNAKRCELLASGRSVSAQRSDGVKLRYREKIDLR